MIQIDVEDAVFHKPSRELWGVGAISPDGTELSPNGWPETIARTSDCLLVDKATDDAREAMIWKWARKKGGYDIRQSWNRQRLAVREAEQEALTVEALDRAARRLLTSIEE